MLPASAFVAPATGERHTYVANGVSKPLFKGLLSAFANEAGAGELRTVALLLDGAGWNAQPGLRIPDGLRLVDLPPPNSSRPSISGASLTSPSSTGG